MVLLYKKNITYYDIPSNKTHFFVLHDNQKRMVEYVHDGLNAVPSCGTKLKIFMKNNENTFEWVDSLDVVAPSPPYRSSYHCGIRRAAKISGVAPNLKKTANRNCHEALSQLLIGFDKDYGDHTAEDALGLRSFMETLSSSDKEPAEPLGTFHSSIVERCTDFILPTYALCSTLKDKPWAQVHHFLICPIVCLKFPNLKIGVIDALDKHSYFYFFDPLEKKVTLQAYKGYWALQDCKLTFYLYRSSKNKYSYYKPDETDSTNCENNLRCHIHSINGNYFLLGPTLYIESLQTLSQFAGLNHGFLPMMDVEEIKNHHFGSEHSDRLIIITQVRSKSTKYHYLPYLGMTSLAIIVLFQERGEGSNPNAYIVHNPRQDPSCAQRTLHEYVEQVREVAPQYYYDSTSDSSSIITARHMEKNTDQDLVLLLYALIASLCQDFNGFLKATEKVCKTDTPDMAVWLRDWVCELLWHRRSSSTSWLHPPAQALQFVAVGESPSTADCDSLSDLSRREPQHANEAINCMIDSGGRRKNQPVALTTHAKHTAHQHRTSVHHEKTEDVDKPVYPKRKRGANTVDERQAKQLKGSSVSVSPTKASYWHAWIRQSCSRHLNHHHIRSARGLTNPKNDCYINVVVQLLFGMKCTRESLLSANKIMTSVNSEEDFATFRDKGGIVTIMMRELFQNIMTSHHKQFVSASLLLKRSIAASMKPSRFCNDEQQDAHEFLLFLLDKLSRNIKVIPDLFGCETITYNVCSSCNHKSGEINDSGSLTLQLGIQGNRIKDFIPAQHSVEIMSDYICNKCSQTTTTQHTHTKARKVLVIQLKRFICTDGGPKKNTIKVQFPLEGLDLGTSSPKYNLVAVIDHEESKKESIEEGHYTISMKAGKTWIRFNDQILSTVHPRNLVTPHAYILVYCQDKLYSDLISDDNERVSYPDYFIEAQQAKVGNETAIGNEDEVLNFPTRQKKRKLVVPKGSPPGFLDMYLDM